MLWVRFPLEATLFLADFETPWCQFCTKIPEMSDLCYLGKTRTAFMSVLMSLGSPSYEMLMCSIIFKNNICFGYFCMLQNISHRPPLQRVGQSVLTPSKKSELCKFPSVCIKHINYSNKKSMAQKKWKWKSFQNVTLYNAIISYKIFEQYWPRPPPPGISGGPVTIALMSV